MGLLNDVFAEVPRTTLFHYTSQAGLLGIVQSRTLWAGDVHYLNDAAEFAHVVRLVREELNVRSHAENGPWNVYYGLLAQRLDEGTIPAIFAVSLSEAGDLLSQWRGYCPNGLGYCVGFEYESLADAIASQGFRIAKCIYDPDVHARMATELISTSGSIIDTRAKDESAHLASVHAAIDDFMERLAVAGPVLKHSAFAEEREWRLIRFQRNRHDPRIRYRTGTSTLIPYCEFDLTSGGRHLGFSTVYVGPTPHMELATTAVRALLDGAGIPHGEVLPSGVPYRPW